MLKKNWKSDGIFVQSRKVRTQVLDLMTQYHFIHPSDVLCSSGGSNAFLRGYQQGLVTLDIHEYVEENQEPFLNDVMGEELKSKIKGCLMSIKCKR